MRTKSSPSLPEIVRVDCSSSQVAISQLTDMLSSSGGGFNYLPATFCVKAAYKGLHNLAALTAGKPLNSGLVGSDANREVTKLVCPLAFGRKTNLIDLSPRTFQFSGRSASYRIPFCFSEKGVVKAFFLQPRKNTLFTRDQLSLYATIVKRFLLDAEFYGENTDLEIVEVAEREEGKGRVVKVFSLSDLDTWDDLDIQRHFEFVNRALLEIEEKNLVKKVRRPLRDRELPLFD